MQTESMSFGINYSDFFQITSDAGRMNSMDHDGEASTITPIMPKRKPRDRNKMPTTKTPSETAEDKVGFSVYTTAAVLDAIEAFMVAYNREHPGANLKRARAVDILLREALRTRGHLDAEGAHAGS